MNTALRRRLDKLADGSQSAPVRTPEQDAAYLRLRAASVTLCEEAGLDCIAWGHRIADGRETEVDKALMDRLPADALAMLGYSSLAAVKAWSWIEREF